MYVIFVAYNYHSNSEFNTNMFTAEDNAEAEKMAKNWLFDRVRYILDLKDLKKFEKITFNCLKNQNIIQFVLHFCFLSVAFLLNFNLLFLFFRLNRHICKFRFKQPHH